jgi:hypothetical protein
MPSALHQGTCRSSQTIYFLAFSFVLQELRLTNGVKRRVQRRLHDQLVTARSRQLTAACLRRRGQPPSTTQKKELLLEVIS